MSINKQYHHKTRSKHLTITLCEQHQTITSQNQVKHKTNPLCEQQQTIASQNKVKAQNHRTLGGNLKKTSQNKVKKLNHHTLGATTNNNITKQGQTTKPSYFGSNNEQEHHKTRSEH